MKGRGTGLATKEYDISKRFKRRLHFISLYLALDDMKYFYQILSVIYKRRQEKVETHKNSENAVYINENINLLNRPS